MKIHIHKAHERGGADYGWLKTRHSFSFGDYYNPKRMGFGTLRVLNDDIISPGKGFDPHSHKEMEIVTIPLEGKLKHEDSTGNSGIITSGEIQRMSAGTGIMHSEYNASDFENAGLLQIWVVPKEKNVKPSYEQKKFEGKDMENKLLKIAGPAKGKNIFINQDANFYMGKFSKNGKTMLKSGFKKPGFFVFVIEGEAKIGEEKIAKRDSAQIEGIKKLQIEVGKGTKLLVIELLM